MDFTLIVSNLTNPTLLYFVLGFVAALLKSDLSIPEGSVKFISLYLLFAIGFKGGQELQHSGINASIVAALLLCMAFAVVVPFYVFFLLRRRLGAENAGAIAAAYGSVSAVTFVTASMFLEANNVAYGGHMVAAMALMEAPAIIIGVLLMRRYSVSNTQSFSIGAMLREVLTNGSVLMIVGSLVIGIISDSKGAEGIKPFTNDIFKGFLAIFLLDMGTVAARRIVVFRSYGLYVTVVALLLPLVNGCTSVFITAPMHLSLGDRLLIAILAASASYIAVPAAMKHAAPNADPGLYIPMALGITFPLNITIGMPIYWSLVQSIQY